MTRVRSGGNRQGPPPEVHNGGGSHDDEPSPRRARGEGRVLRRQREALSPQAGAVTLPRRYKSYRRIAAYPVRGIFKEYRRIYMYVQDGPKSEVYQVPQEEAE